MELRSVENELKIPIFKPYPMTSMEKFLFSSNAFIDLKILLSSLLVIHSCFKAVQWFGIPYSKFGFDSNVAIIMSVNMVHPPAFSISKTFKLFSTSSTFSKSSTIIGVNRKLTAIPNCEANILKPDIKLDSFLLNQFSANFDGKFDRNIWKIAHAACPTNT